MAWAFSPNMSPSSSCGSRAIVFSPGAIKSEAARSTSWRGVAWRGVAGRGDTVAFVEVKVRPTLDEARMSIDAVKRRRISCAARNWLASNPWAATFTWRGDAVYVAPWRWPRHEIAVMELDLG